MIIISETGNSLKCHQKLWVFIKRKGWYALLLITSTIYVLVYRNDIHQFENFNAQNLIFILWLMLLLLPLFSEMEFLGIRLKKEIEEVKAENKERLNDIKFQLMDLRVSNSIANTIQINSAPLPAEKELSQLNKAVQEIQPKEPQDVNEHVDIEQMVSASSVYLFKVRLSIESLLSKLCERTGYKGNKSIMQMTQFLTLCEIIDRKEVDLIQQLMKISNRGIHGEIISTEYISFVEKACPQIINNLQNAYNQLQYVVCPKCRYTGYARYEHVCPKCGSGIYDDY